MENTESNKSLDYEINSGNINTEDKNILKNVAASGEQILNTKKEGLKSELRIVKILQKKLDIEITKEIKEINNEKFTFDTIKIILFPLFKIQPNEENIQIPNELNKLEPKDTQNIAKKLNKNLPTTFGEITHSILENGNLTIKKLEQKELEILLEQTKNLKDSDTTNQTTKEGTNSENNKRINIESDQNFCKKSHEKNSENLSDEKISFESETLKKNNSIKTLSLDNDNKNKKKSQLIKKNKFIIQYSSDHCLHLAINFETENYLAYFDFDKKKFFKSKNQEMKNYFIIDLILTIKDNKKILNPKLKFSNNEMISKFNEIFPSKTTGIYYCISNKELDGFFSVKNEIDLSKNFNDNLISYDNLYEKEFFIIPKDSFVIVECKNSNKLNIALDQVLKNYYLIKDLITSNKKIVIFIILTEKLSAKNTKQLLNTINNHKLQIFVYICDDNKLFGYSLEKDIIEQDIENIFEKLDQIQKKNEEMNLKLDNIMNLISNFNFMDSKNISK